LFSASIIFGHRADICSFVVSYFKARSGTFQIVAIKNFGLKSIQETAKRALALIRKNPRNLKYTGED
jgi:hypothetical protein